MKLIGTVLLLLFTISFTSCTSEYEERLEEAKLLRQRLLLVEETHFLSPKAELVQEMEQIQTEISFLAKISGNEELFMEEIEKY